MTATDELRRLLDERGVEWHESVTDLSLQTSWSTKKNFCSFSEWNEHVDIADTLTVYHATPAQAVEATLGRGECRNVITDGTGFKCSECGAHISAWILTDFPRFGYCPNCGRKVVDA